MLVCALNGKLGFFTEEVPHPAEKPFAIMLAAQKTQSIWSIVIWSSQDTFQVLAEYFKLSLLLLHFIIYNS